MKTIAVMQPTYLPWLGYFALMSAVDEFVFLDDVQFARRSWQQRNRIKVSAGELMLTVPVFKKDKRDQLIKEVEIDWSSRFEQKHVRSIEKAYGRAQYWSTHGAPLCEAIATRTTHLAEYNITIISLLQGMLEIDTPSVRSSNLPLDGKREDRLIAICKARGADAYVSPPGSRAYLEGSDAFERAGIALHYFEYNHPIYPQLHNDFISHLSVTDLILNCGDDSLAMLERGVQLKDADSQRGGPTS